MKQPTLPSLTNKQRARLRLDEHAGLATLAQTKKLVQTVGIALRYGANASLPLASMYAAVAKSVPRAESEDDTHRRAAVLTNGLIADGHAIETNTIADRLCIVDDGLAAAIVALVRRGRAPDELDLDDMAERAMGYIANAERPTAGQVRAFLGAPKTWPNPADDALAELQRLTLIDRGANEVPKTGMAYLGKDGIPYRVFDAAHPAIVKRAAKLTVETAARELVGRYLAGAVFAARRKLASMFSLLVDRDELDAAIAALVEDGEVRVAKIDGKELLIASA
jgi:hypothetical protein